MFEMTLRKTPAPFAAFPTGWEGPRALGEAVDPDRSAWLVGTRPRRRGGAALLRASWIAFLLLTLTQVTAAFVLVNPVALTILLHARRLIWLVSILGCVAEIILAEDGGLLAPLLGFVPFMLIGTASALLGVEPIAGLVQVVFWAITMIGACLIGRRLRDANLPAILIGWFIAVLLASIVLALWKPGLAVDLDNRTAHGAWRGVFGGKNWLAWYSVYALLLAGFARDVSWLPRVALAGLAAVCLHFAHSAGALVMLAAVCAMMAVIEFWRSLPISPALRLMANALTFTFLGLAGAMGYGLVLGALGRDTTLTGRTFLWQAYFDRALDSWLYGAGPGSFTSLSLTTQDIGLRFRAHGNITTPHNMYIATFGEVGVLGVLAYVLPLLALVLFDPARGDRAVPLAGPSESAGFAPPVACNVPAADHRASRQIVISFALLFLVSGFEETHDVYGISSGLFLILLMRAWQWNATRQAGALMLRKVAPVAAPGDLAPLAPLAGR